jgi:hypothetical protein
MYGDIPYHGGLGYLDNNNSADQSGVPFIQLQAN